MDRICKKNCRNSLALIAAALPSFEVCCESLSSLVESFSTELSILEKRGEQEEKLPSSISPSSFSSSSLMK